MQSMHTKHWLFDGIKQIPLGYRHPGERLFANPLFESDTEHLTPLEGYHAVPYLYRAVSIRAMAMASMPWALYRVDTHGMPDYTDNVRDNPLYATVVRGMQQRLMLTESSLCLYGAAYWLKETNRAGLNLTPRWVVPTSITPRIDPRDGLQGFTRTWSGGSQELGTDQVVAIWLPSMTAEIGPGIAPARVALSSAQILANLDVFIEGFFRRGMIRPTLVAFEGSNPSQQELERVESRWKRMFSGIRNAWNTMAVRGSVKVLPLGDGIAELQDKDLTRQQRENICAALGVPHSLLSADAATYATAQNDTITFLKKTIIPEAMLIAEALNEQLFAPLGLKMAFLPNQLEELQQYEVSKTNSIVPLVQNGIMTVEEARAQLELTV